LTDAPGDAVDSAETVSGCLLAEGTALSLPLVLTLPLLFGNLVFVTLSGLYGSRP
jgi:hypothetical protein